MRSISNALEDRSTFPTFPRWTFQGVDDRIKFGVMAIYEDGTVEARPARWETQEQAFARNPPTSFGQDLLELVGLMWVGSSLFWFDPVYAHDWVVVRDKAGRSSPSILDIPDCPVFQKFISTDSPRKPAARKAVAA